MEIDQDTQIGARSGSAFGNSPRNYYIDESMAEHLSRPAKDRAVQVLDRLELHVERLRKEAARLEEDKDYFLASLDTLKNSDLVDNLDEFEKDDVLRYADRVIQRCQTVEVKVNTNRDQVQEEALFQVNHLIDLLVVSLRTDPDGTKLKCITYMNACSSENVGGGVTDKNFENALLGCTIDDQKRIKKRLQGLLNYFDNSCMFVR